MTYLEFIDDVRFRTNTTESTFPVKDIVRIANNFLVSLSGKINKIDEDTLGTTAEYNLIEGQREYPLTVQVSTYGNKQVEALLNDKWVVLDEVDIAAWRGVTDEDSISSHFGMTKDTAAYDIWRKSIVLYTHEVPQATGGLVIHFLGEIEPLTVERMDSDEEMSLVPGEGEDSWKHGIPKEFHEITSMYASINYKQSSDRETPLTERELNWKNELQDQLNSLRGGNKQRVTDKKAERVMGKYGYGYNL